MKIERWIELVFFFNPTEKVWVLSRVGFFGITNDLPVLINSITVYRYVHVLSIPYATV